MVTSSADAAVPATAIRPTAAPSNSFLGCILSQLLLVNLGNDACLENAERGRVVQHSHDITAIRGASGRANQGPLGSRLSLVGAGADPGTMPRPARSASAIPTANSTEPCPAMWPATPTTTASHPGTLPTRTLVAISQADAVLTTR